MKSAFRRCLQTDSNNSSRTEDIFDLDHEQSKFRDVCATSDEYSVERSSKIRSSLH